MAVCPSEKMTRTPFQDRSTNSTFKAIRLSIERRIAYEIEIVRSPADKIVVIRKLL